MVRDIRPTRGPDLSVFVLLLISIFVIWGIVQASRMMHNAQLGLIRFERAQRDLFIDAGLIEASRRVRVKPALSAELSAQTVMVISRMNHNRSAVGSGVIVQNNSRGILILTAKHIVRRGGPVFVVFRTPQYVRINAKRISLSASHDLALLWIAPIIMHLRTAHFARHDLQTRDRFIVMGHPGAHSWLASAGIAERHLHDVFLYCPQCDRGDSGAGVFNVRGELTGIVISKVFIDAPNARTGARMHAIAFFMESLKDTRAFVQTHNVSIY